jgi:methionine synthase II (cobalamin-independent)
LIGENIRKDARGVKQVAFIGVTNPRNRRIETPEEVYNDLMTAAKYIEKDQLGATDDYSFSLFSISVNPCRKPNRAASEAESPILRSYEGS